MVRMQLLSNQVCVWAKNIQTLNDKTIQEQAQYLSAEEHKRADRFVHNADAKRFIIAYSGLRLILAKYLPVPKGNFAFKRNEHGKPYLINSPLCFNLSHSNDYVIWAFALNNSVGIDIEYEKKNVDVLALAKRFFAKEEYTTLKNISSENQLSAFYRCWTRKEAFIKAIGKGLSYPLNKFAVTFEKKIYNWTIPIENKSDDQKWYLYSLKTPEKYTAAIVLKKPIDTIQYNEFSI